jgi:hypothetical protein
LNSVDGSGYDVPFQRKNWHGQIANPGFIPVPSFNPYPMMFHQQQLPSGWPYPFAYPSSLNPAGVPSNKQFDGEYGEEEAIDVKQKHSDLRHRTDCHAHRKGIDKRKARWRSQCQKEWLVFHGEFIWICNLNGSLWVTYYRH